MKCKICLNDTELLYNKNKLPQIIKVLDYEPELGKVLYIDGKSYYVSTIYKKGELVGVIPFH